MPWNTSILQAVLICISQGGLTYIRYIIGQVKHVIIKFQIFTSDAFDQDFDVKTVNRVKKVTQKSSFFYLIYSLSPSLVTT